MAVPTEELEDHVLALPDPFSDAPASYPYTVVITLKTSGDPADSAGLARRENGGLCMFGGDEQ